uniref:Uncharacterized protein n=1 Tax=Syphacia muris TaxID=451379 RepID=A0A0N5AFD4_9BILA
MNGIFRKFFRSSHTSDDCELDNRGKKNRSLKLNQLGVENRLNSTAAYHTIGQPRTYRSSRSYAGCENFSRRRRILKSWGRRCNATEYGNASMHLSNYIRDSTLDDSESDCWTLEREKQNYELEKKLQEERERLKEYRERFKMERDLRLSREKEIKEYRDRFKLERELRFRREEEIIALKESLKKMKLEQEKLIVVTNNLQAKFNFWEQQQQCRTMFPAIMNGMFGIGAGAGESLCTTSAPSAPMPSVFSQIGLQNPSDEIDETKNFRSANLFHSEFPRSITSLSLSLKAFLTVIFKDFSHITYISKSYC